MSESKSYNPAPSGAELIAAERRRQIEAEGWTPEHDDSHTLGELAAAGACYALLETRWRDASILHFGNLIRSILWPWDDPWFKPAQLPGEPPWSRTIIRSLPIKNLVRAGALIAAEIDRLQRDNLRLMADAQTLRALIEAAEERDRLAASEWIDGETLADQARTIRELKSEAERLREALTASIYVMELTAPKSPKFVNSANLSEYDIQEMGRILQMARTALERK